VKICVDPWLNSCRIFQSAELNKSAALSFVVEAFAAPNAYPADDVVRARRGEHRYIS
jgi:hypothetical protein